MFGTVQFCSTFHSPTDSGRNPWNPVESRNSAGIDRIPAGILSIPYLRIQKQTKKITKKKTTT
jgi:hypothetical protein